LDLLLIRLNDLRGRYCMQPGSYTRAAGDPGGTPDACDRTLIGAAIGANNRDDDTA
jgi:hypothetical protein